MGRITITVPASQVTALTEALLGTYAAKAESVGYAAADHLKHRRSHEVLLDHRSIATEIAEVLDQLGWSLDRPPGEVTLQAPRELLIEATATALTGAVEDLSEASTALLETRASRADVGAGLATAQQLFALIEQLDEAA